MIKFISLTCLLILVSSCTILPFYDIKKADYCQRIDDLTYVCEDGYIREFEYYPRQSRVEE